MILTILAVLLLVSSAARLLVVDNRPVSSDAVVVLGGGGVGRFQTAVKIYDDGMARKIVLVGGNEKNWLALLKQWSTLIELGGRDYIVLADSPDTRSDAQLTLNYSKEKGIGSIVVVTSPYHTRRSQLIFDDVFAGSGIDTVVVSADDYGKLIPPDGPWWHDRQTVETVWLEFGKTLYWELTPFMEFQGEGEKLREGERAR
ncbi:MAG: YdcF family protein [Desulfuromonadales bacterium]|nr:YdcF family protein [Desulfuromonadales bacterium]